MLDVTLLNRELVSRAKCLVSVFPDIVKDCPKMTILPKIFLRRFENVGPQICTSTAISCDNSTLVGQIYDVSGTTQHAKIGSNQTKAYCGMKL